MYNHNHNDNAVMHWKIDKEVFWEKVENGMGNYIGETDC